ncbi:MAG: acyl-CoA dehydrogenase [Acidimicrobiaceae bacterium]|nr:acyl-CoA dehydrogenase [Acidimicrobiaceae bacterium]
MDLSLSADERAFALEVRTWLDRNIDRPDPALSGEEAVDWGRRWQARLADARMVAISWPESVGGRAATPVEVALYNMEYARAGAPQPVNRVGINLAGPTLLAHGTPAQQQRWLPSILDASEIWCQLFSEPDAGSDLASLRTRAEPAAGGWLVTGEKVWTSYAGFARWGIALVRTDLEVEGGRHSGISCMVIDMEAPGVEVRPLRQITGESEFNQVGLDEVFVPKDCLVGGLHQGWTVASTTLAHERGTSYPFKEQVVHEIFFDELMADIRALAAMRDPVTADGLVDAYVALRLLRLRNYRTLSRLGRGIEPGPDSSIAKLIHSSMTRRLSAAALDVLGAEAPLWPEPAGDLTTGTWQRQWLWSKAASIAGGTDEIQRNIVAERLLGLPRG